MGFKPIAIFLLGCHPELVEGCVYGPFSYGSTRLTMRITHFIITRLLQQQLQINTKAGKRCIKRLRGIGPVYS